MLLQKFFGPFVDLKYVIFVACKSVSGGKPARDAARQ